MMQQAHLTRWAQEAPWPKRSQIEQDLRISRGVAAIFADPFLADHVAMRGGTVLHKGHLAPAARYSEDIDLVLVRHVDTKAIEEHLTRALVPALGQPAGSLIEDAKLAIRNLVRPSKILRIAFKFVPLGLQYAETIKVEVNLNESASLYPLVDIGVKTLNEDGEVETPAARSYDINEMLGTKTRALMQRDQGRDLFDLHHAWEESVSGRTAYTVDGAKAMAAFAWYLEKEGVVIGRADANAYLDQRLQNKSFRNDMNSLLRPGAAAFDVDVAATSVREAYFRHLP